MILYFFGKKNVIIPLFGVVNSARFNAWYKIYKYPFLEMV
jgi:hypothetical protein